MTIVSIKTPSADTALEAPEVQNIAVSLVDVPKDHRKHPQFAVQAMAEDIAVRGQLQPIEVLSIGDRYQLTFGRLRLEALAYLNLPVIAAIVKTPSEFISEAEPRLRSISEALQSRTGVRSIARHNPPLSRDQSLPRRAAMN